MALKATLLIQTRNWKRWRGYGKNTLNRLVKWLVSKARALTSDHFVGSTKFSNICLTRKGLRWLLGRFRQVPRLRVVGLDIPFPKSLACLRLALVGAPEVAQ